MNTTAKITSNYQTRQCLLTYQSGYCLIYKNKQYSIAGFKPIPETWGPEFAKWEYYYGDYKSGIVLNEIDRNGNVVVGSFSR